MQGKQDSKHYLVLHHSRVMGKKLLEGLGGNTDPFSKPELFIHEEGGFRIRRRKPTKFHSEMSSYKPQTFVK
jgi:hypothetical protein